MTIFIYSIYIYSIYILIYLSPGCSGVAHVGRFCCYPLAGRKLKVKVTFFTTTYLSLLTLFLG